MGHLVKARRPLPFTPRRTRTPAGTVEIGFGVVDVQAFQQAMTAKGVTFAEGAEEAGIRRAAGTVPGFGRGLVRVTDH